MKLAVQQNHLGRHILYRKNGVNTVKKVFFCSLENFLLDFPIKMADFSKWLKNKTKFFVCFAILPIEIPIKIKSDFGPFSDIFQKTVFVKFFLDKDFRQRFLVLFLTIQSLDICKVAQK